MESHTTETHTIKTTQKATPRSAAVNALATVGFIALLLIGITLAIYGARYIPEAASKLTSEIKGFGDHDASTTPGTLTVVTATSTTAVPFTNSPTFMGTPAVRETQTAAVINATAPSTPAPHSVTNTSHTAAPHGLPDLSATIIATGYLTGDSTASFVPARIIPPGARPAVKFAIANKGTNVTGPWNFLARIPTLNGYIFNSPIEQSMGPGDHIEFTLGFNQALPGDAQTITVVADPNNQIQESSEGNNSAAAAVTITATGN